MRLIDADEIRIKPEYMHDICGIAVIRVEDIVRILNDMPPIEPEPHWIPCGDGKPDEFERVLTTISIPRRDPKVRSGTYHSGLFNNDNGDCWNSTDMEVVAWMPLPSPYQPEEESG